MVATVRIAEGRLPRYQAAWDRQPAANLRVGRFVVGAASYRAPARADDLPAQLRREPIGGDAGDAGLMRDVVLASCRSPGEWTLARSLPTPRRAAARSWSSPPEGTPGPLRVDVRSCGGGSFELLP